jgi:hypothetical protein
MAAHADADDRHLGQSLIPSDRIVADRFRDLQAPTSALSASLDGKVKVMSVVAPSAEMFCTIMSTLMPASASGPKTPQTRPAGPDPRSEICASSRA